MVRIPQCYIPSFVGIGLPVPEKKVFEGFLPYVRPPPGFWGTGEQGHLIQGNRGTKAIFFRGTAEQRQFISGEKGSRCTPREWEGLIYGRGGHLGHVTSILHQFFISLRLKTFIQNLVQNNTVVSEKIRFEFLNVHDLGPRSRNDDLQY